MKRQNIKIYNNALVAHSTYQNIRLHLNFIFPIYVRVVMGGEGMNLYSAPTNDDSPRNFHTAKLKIYRPDYFSVYLSYESFEMPAVR